MGIARLCSTRSPAHQSVCGRSQYAGDHGQTTAGGIPILALDMYEHAYHIDFGANAQAYIDAFQRNIDWVSTQARYEDASKVEAPRPLVQKEFGDLPSVRVEEVKAMLDSGEPVQIIDARPRSYISRQQDIMDGAVWPPMRASRAARTMSRKRGVRMLPDAVRHDLT